MFNIRIFVSHASADKEIVSSFVNSVIILGAGVPKECVAYTSDAGLGVSPGENIPGFIKENILSANLVLLMISDNYRGSEVCLNEMGAAWALEKRVVQILLPDVSFSRLGWLLSLDKAIKIADSTCLDSLGDVISEIKGSALKMTTWNRHKDDFLRGIGKVRETLPAAPDSSLPVNERESEEELGLFDYSEKVSEYNALFIGKLSHMSDSLKKVTEVVRKRSELISKVNPSSPGSASVVKKHFQVVAVAMNRTSDVFDEQMIDLKRTFYGMVDACIKVTELSQSDKETKESDLRSVRSMISEMDGCTEQFITLIDQMNDVTAAEKSFISARKRLIACLSKMNGIFSDCRGKAGELAVELL